MAQGILGFADDRPTEGPLPQVFYVPHQRDPNFTGREQFLHELRTDLTQDQGGGRIQAIYGLGGVGKTLATLEYAYRHREDYKLVYWFSAEDPASLWVQFLNMGRALHLPAAEERSLDLARMRLREHLETRGDFLLIFDNAPDADAIRAFVPSPCRGHVLITSRNPNWSGLARSSALHGLTREESVQFLRRRTGRFEPEATYRKLAQALGDLPLALDQAAAAIRQSQCSVAQYLEQFEGHWAATMASQRPGGEWPDSVQMAWEISLRHLEESRSPAIELLTLLSFLDYSGVPQRLLSEHFTLFPDSIAGICADPMALSRSIDLLVEHAMIHVGQGEGGIGPVISLHRLIAALVRSRLDDDQRRRWAGVAARVASAAFVFDYSDPSTWAAAGLALPQALATATHAQAAGVPVEVTTHLLDQSGRYLNRMGQYEQARAVLDRALELSMRAYGEHSPRVSNVANNLGRVLARLGRMDQARQYFESALAIDRGIYGEADPRVATVLNNYAMVLHGQGLLAEAQQCFEQALMIFEMHYGVQHPKVATLLNNLGYVLLNLGDVATALERFGRALGTAQEVMGRQHPLVASICHNQGVAQQKLGQLPQARQAFSQALAIDEVCLGPHHPDVARDCRSLAGVLKLMNDPAADGYVQRAAEIVAAQESGASSDSSMRWIVEGSGT